MVKVTDSIQRRARKLIRRRFELMDEEISMAAERLVFSMLHRSTMPTKLRRVLLSDLAILFLEFSDNYEASYKIAVQRKKGLGLHRILIANFMTELSEACEALLLEEKTKK